MHTATAVFVFEVAFGAPTGEARLAPRTKIGSCGKAMNRLNGEAAFGGWKLYSGGVAFGTFSMTRNLSDCK